MNRADLSWALNAVLPHCGRTEQTDIVGIEYLQGVTYIYATDKYTIGIARITTDAANINGYLSRSEATELMRFVRPANKAEQAQDLSFGQREGELHVGFEDDSAVFDTAPHPGLDLDYLLQKIQLIYEKPLDWEEAIYQPKLFEKFAKAQRQETDRLRIFPRRAQDRNGLAVVTVGPDFMGAISGLTYDQQGADTVSALLPERKVA